MVSSVNILQHSETMSNFEQEEGQHQQLISNKEDRAVVDADESSQIPLMALNHISRLCKSVRDSVNFYVNVLGFVELHRPPSLDFDGAWLFNYGIGIHLVQKEDGGRISDASPDTLDPMDNHISFQCEDMDAMERRLKKMNIRYMKRTINEEEGAPIDQLFFNDPDGFMIEICNCENLELVPAGSVGKIKLPRDRHNPPLALTTDIVL